MKKVTSSTIDSIHYDPDTKLLEIQFKSGGTYHYSDVSQEAYDALDNAESVGKHFHSHIRGKHAHTKKGDGKK